MSFHGFSPDSFEQFIRALSIKTIGPGVTVFGNGPDGGREATFQGRINYPHPPQTTWEGYGVIQAKFKERVEDADAEQAWAEKQLKRELNTWVESQIRIPKPDYYIYCTNVELTSAKGGGRERLEAVFKDFYPKLNLKGHAIWDANQLTAFVDGCAEIRQRFKCFFTTGDLLESYANCITRTPCPDTILTNYLCRELLSDEDARLSQAGDRSEDRIRLASVFVDLRVALAPSLEPPEDEMAGHLPPAALHDLLKAASNKLDPLALHEYRKESTDHKYPSHRFGRYVLLGGPGSGKSTIGQFLAQIHRAALLLRREAHRVEPKVLKVADEIKKRCDEEKAIWPKTPRYPFRIELNSFAKALAAGANTKDGVDTLSEYIRKKLSQDTIVCHEDIRNWFQQFPCLLILDGLDEVPPSSNRHEVVAAIQNFLIEARDLQADLMVIATSRPDGYSGEFDGDEVAQFHLLPFSKNRALVCAQRYVNAKSAVKGDQRAGEAMSIIKNSIENPLIARLMRSPLQVTFMVTVVAASGKPSESRWQLFNDYYRTIYERELHKAVRPFDKVLNERRQDIDALHHRVGFILQCRGELSGGTQADLSLVEFQDLVRDCLEENGLSGDELEKLVDGIVGAASQRLVFLTSRTHGRLSFDVRSLQEYMAAACITNADSDEILKRLDAVAHSAYWKNTFLFAIGSFFVEPKLRPHREKIRILCDDLNRKDVKRSESKLGSRLALDILEGGIIGHVPLFSRSLACCALELLVFKPGKTGVLSRRLSQVFEKTLAEEYQSKLSIWLGQQKIVDAMSAWLLVFFLTERDVVWARELAEKHWPINIKDECSLMNAWLACTVNSDLVRGRFIKFCKLKLSRLIPRVSLREFSAQLSYLSMDDEGEETHLPKWLCGLTTWWNSGSYAEGRTSISDEESSVTLRFVPIPTRSSEFETIRTLGLEPDLHQDWKDFLLIEDFYSAPNRVTLGDCLERIAKARNFEFWDDLSDRVAWPLAYCIKSGSSQEGLHEMARLVIEGAMGDIDDWVAMEQNWKDGINFKGFCKPLFNGGIPLLSCVRAASGSSEPSEEAVLLGQALLTAAENSSDERLKESISWIFAFHVSASGILHEFDPNKIWNSIIPARKCLFPTQFVLRSGKANDNLEKWIDFYDRFGQMPNLVWSSSDWNVKLLPLASLFQGYAENISRVGLLRLLGFWCSVGAENTLNNTPVDDQLSNSNYRFASVLCRLAKKNLDMKEVQAISKEFDADMVQAESKRAPQILFNLIESRAKTEPALECVLDKVIPHIPDVEWQIHGRAVGAKYVFLQGGGVVFSKELCNTLGLPYL